jgi:hypothetical protein
MVKMNESDKDIGQQILWGSGAVNVLSTWLAITLFAL